MLIAGCIVAVGIVAGVPADVGLPNVVEIVVGLFSAVTTAAFVIGMLID